MSSKKITIKIKGRELGKRIAEIRGKRTQAEFAQLVGVSQPAIHQYEGGRVPRQPQILMRIAELDPAGRGVFWLMYGPDYQPQVGEGGVVPYDFTVPYVSTPEEEKRDTLPVVGYLSAGKLDVAWTDAGLPVGEGLYRIEKPAWLKDKNCFGLEIRGDSMYPPFAPRTIVVVDTKAQIVNRDMVVCRVRSLEAFWKIYSERAGIVMLESVNPGVPAMTFKKEEILYKYKVVQILPPRRRN